MHLALKTRGLLPQPTRPPSPIAASTEASPLRLQPFPVLPIRPSLSGKGQEEKGQSFAWNREANLGEARPNKHSPGKFPFQKSQEGFRSCASDSHLYLKVGRTPTQVNATWILTPLNNAATPNKTEPGSPLALFYSESLPWQSEIEATGPRANGLGAQWPEFSGASRD